MLRSGECCRRERTRGYKSNEVQHTVWVRTARYVLVLRHDLLELHQVAIAAAGSHGEEQPRHRVHVHHSALIGEVNGICVELDVRVSWTSRTLQQHCKGPIGPQPCRLSHLA